MDEGIAADKKLREKAPKEGDVAWAWLAKKNGFDLRLYTYVERLFEEQVRCD